MEIKLTNFNLQLKKVMDFNNQQKKSIKPDFKCVLWPGNITQCVGFLSILPYCDSTNDLINFITKSSQIYVDVDDSVVDLIEKIKNL